MTMVYWDEVITGASLEEAYAKLRDRDRHDYGRHQNGTGSAADHETVVQVHDEDGQGPVSEERALELAYGAYFDHDSALAIRLRTEPGQPLAWLAFGKSHM